MTRWYQEKKREHFYKEAKKTGYRARSAFKLKQIQKKFKIIKQDDIVVDLGAAPGGWSQVAKELVGKQGTVIGVDLSQIKPLDGITFLQGDLTKENTIKEISEVLEDKKPDIILSDMSPNISGNYTVDHARSIYLCEQALSVSKLLLRKDGCFVCKVFDGEDLQGFVNKVKKQFKTVKQFNPVASRKSSSEVYIIGRYHKKF
jgi:23S rRNA (uridine2552-2'-O)-methyltransferase